LAKVLTPVGIHELEPHAIETLGLAVGHPDPEGMARVLERYEQDTNYSIYVCQSGRTLGVVGFETLAVDDVRIRHIAVDPAGQNSGVGRLMISASVQELGFKTLRAETDADAVGFYSACGFSVDSLGELYPGVERFECTLHAKR
jgi:ribosomal protein S18 acetylase RimI-like enzyme